MHPINKLPNELLVEIFEYLPLSDTARCAQTCKQFYKIVSKSQIKDYNVKIDHPCHSAWKLIRCLLINPKIGERFQKLTFTYHPRRCCLRKTWTLQWRWTAEEETELELLCHVFDITPAYKWIKNGIYGDSIFPLLLGYTTNLKSLDLGRGVNAFVYPDPFHSLHKSRTVLRVWDVCCGKDYLSTVKNREGRNLNDVYCHGDLWEFYGDYMSACLRFSATLDQCVSRLSNLREFTYWGARTGDGCEDCPELEMTDFVLKVLSLPRLEAVRIGKEWHFKKRCMDMAAALPGSHRLLPTKRIPEGVKSTIKHLELRYDWLMEEDMKDFAEFTGKLESLKLILGDEATIEEGEKVAGFFLENNRETLTKERVVVEMDDSSDFEDWAEEEDLESEDNSNFYDDEE
ncbi:uncharacterized protein DFL_003208 [Arthrobotrys flagrans]|uniref:F-box domain-containing protein n=1 Tax=Arthrobotrys flagrans TaxID=97331 RepID=A0A437A0S8_ARTFL|nr:hypothetical protein DFL_003208 [Arthrobotrys flagrans]